MKRHWSKANRYTGTSKTIRLLTMCVVLTALMGAGPTVAKEWTLNTLYSFCAEARCADGNMPVAGLLKDSAGNLYGTATEGGANKKGVVFELIPTGGEWKEKVLYSFCSQKKCIDGGEPDTTLIVDQAGNLYGTTPMGGAGNGTIFELMPNAAKTKWTLKTLYNFCPKGDSCLDGAEPVAELTYQGAATGTPYDGVSPLYGTTVLGGNQYGGTAFRLIPNHDSTWTEEVIYSFCTIGGEACTDGASPRSGLLLDGAGDLFGTTSTGANFNTGVVFEISPAGSDQWTETTLYSFCPGDYCVTGEYPVGTVILDAAGHLLGTTRQGGEQGDGIVFSLIPNGKSSKIKTLFSLCPSPSDGCTSGGWPLAGPVIDASGALFGTTSLDGQHSGGTVYRLKGAKFSKLYDFCEESICGDGASSAAPLILDNSGGVLGTTRTGGKFNGGTVFQLMP